MCPQLTAQLVQINPPLQVVSMKPGCQAHSPDFILPPFFENSSTKVHNGSRQLVKFENVTSHIWTPVDKVLLPDVKIPQRLGDIEKQLSINDLKWMLKAESGRQDRLSGKKDHTHVLIVIVVVIICTIVLTLVLLMYVLWRTGKIPTITSLKSSVREQHENRGIELSTEEMVDTEVKHVINKDQEPGRSFAYK